MQRPNFLWYESYVARAQIAMNRVVLKRHEFVVDSSPSKFRTKHFLASSIYHHAKNVLARSSQFGEFVQNRRDVLFISNVAQDCRIAFPQFSRFICRFFWRGFDVSYIHWAHSSHLYLLVHGVVIDLEKVAITMFVRILISYLDPNRVGARARSGAFK